MKKIVLLSLFLLSCFVGISQQKIIIRGAGAIDTTGRWVYNVFLSNDSMFYQKGGANVYIGKLIAVTDDSLQTVMRRSSVLIENADIVNNQGGNAFYNITLDTTGNQISYYSQALKIGHDLYWHGKNDSVSHFGVGNGGINGIVIGSNPANFSQIEMTNSSNDIGFRTTFSSQYNEATIPMGTTFPGVFHLKTETGAHYVFPREKPELGQILKVTDTTTSPGIQIISWVDAIDSLKVDSVKIYSSTCVDTFKYWVSGTATTIATVDKQNGLNSGGAVTPAATDTTFDVAAAVYKILCERYASAATLVTLNGNSDSAKGRIDVIGVNTSGVVFGLQGTNATNPIAPALSATQLGLATVTFPPLSDSGIVNIYNNYDFNGIDSSAYREVATTPDSLCFIFTSLLRSDTICSTFGNRQNIISGAVVTQIDSTRFNVSPGSYYIQGSLYANGDTTFNLDTPGDTSRIDVIGLDTTGNVFTITGVESENPYPSSIDPLSQIYLSFVWVDTDTVYFAPTPVNYWSALGNDIINNNSGKVRFTNGLSMDQITANDSRLFSGAKQLVLQSNKTTGVRILTGRVGGNVDLNTTELQLSLGDNSTTGTAKTALSLTGRSLHASGTEAMNMISITPSLVQSGTYTGTVRGIYYNPTVTANLGTHYAFESTLGRIKFGGMETGDTTTYKPLGIDASGNLRQIASWPAGGGGGGVGTLQQTLTAGSTLTTDNTIVADDKLLYIDSVNKFRVVSKVNGTSFADFQVAKGETYLDARNSTTGINVNLIPTMMTIGNPIGGQLNLRLVTLPQMTEPRYGLGVTTNDTVKLYNAMSTEEINQQLTDSLSVLRDSIQVLWDSLEVYRSQDTVYTTSGIETVYSGDSTTIRLPYKSYVALISQNDTDPPTAIVLQNDFDETFTFTYNATGSYRIISANGNFTEDKTFLLSQNTETTNQLNHCALTYVNSGRINLLAFDSGSALTDTLLNKVSIEIRVFY